MNRALELLTAKIDGLKQGVENGNIFRNVGEQVIATLEELRDELLAE